MRPRVLLFRRLINSLGKKLSFTEIDEQTLEARSCLTGASTPFTAFGVAFAAGSYLYFFTIAVVIQESIDSWEPYV